MPRVPRELSKCRNWEKERRDRLSKAFEELAKALPSYVPSLKICKIEILNQALATILELKKEVDTISSADKSKSFKDEQIKKLQDRIKRLIVRNEQLTGLFKEAGITLPKVVGPIKKFRKPGLWSNRFPRNAEAVRKNETEKENVSSNGVRSKLKRSELVGASPVKCTKIKKNAKNAAGGSKNNVLLLSQIPAVPTINRQLVLVPNTPLNNVQQAPTVLTSSSKKQTKSSKVKPTNSTHSNSGSSSNLTPGTLILGNANVISLLPQPQLMIPQLPSQTIVISKVITKPRPFVTLRKNLPIRPSNCVTNTTQIIKVPIPALTSNYASSSAILKSAGKKTNSAKKTSVRTSKRKKSAKNVEAKKQKPETRDESNKKDDQSNETQQTDADKDTRELQNIVSSTENTGSGNDNDKPDSNTAIEINSTGNTEKLISIESSIRVEETATVDHEIPVSSSTDNNWLQDKRQELSAPSVEAPQASSSKTEDVPIKSKATKTTAVIEDPMKNIDLNLVHSDLSNDIFASLQVPPGCQNAESTSPTAAFLLAFPLVSSIKVTEVIDEENSDSQRETPTLLQIGGMDSSKPNDGLLNLDNFPFFNSNTNYYSSKANAKNSEAQNSKLDSEAFNMYSESDRGLLFPKSQMKTADKSTGKSNENHMDNMLGNEQYIENNEVLFEQNKLKSFQESDSKLTHVNSDKMQSSCNVLSVMNIAQEQQHSHSAVSKFNLSENVHLPKQLDNSANKMDVFAFKDTAQKHNSDLSCQTFPVNQSSSQTKTSDVNKINDTYFNPLFEALKTCKSNAKIVDKENECLKEDCSKGANEVCPKSPCYFSSNFSTAPNYKADFSKQCSYESQRNYPTPFYTNCNYSYNYPDANAQNYYKSDSKSCYSLNYENYQEYRKTDATFSNNFPNTPRKGSAGSKDKSKTVNWMTEQKTQDGFLPSFTNQSYSFTETPDVNNLLDPKKADFIDKRLSLPSFLEPHNFITPTLPTLVGDLALGNTLTTNDSKMDYKCAKEAKRKIGYDNQANFLSVSQLVSHKPDNVAVKPPARRLSGSKSKTKRCEKSSIKHGNNFDMFYEQKTRQGHNKNALSSYSAEALIGTQETKKCDSSAKTLLSDNIIPYFTTIDDGYTNQNQNFHNSYGHNSFQNNNYPSNNFIYTTPSISTGYLSNNFEANSHDYSDNTINYNKNYNKNYRTNGKDDKNTSYSSGNVKRSKKSNQGNFDYPLLPIQGATNSPVLTDDFQSHATFLPPPAAPYSCKNSSLYQKQTNDFNLAPVNAGTLLPLPGISRGNIQHPQISPSSNTAGTSLTNFNLSTIFPEINKASFNADSKYNFSG